MKIYGNTIDFYGTKKHTAVFVKDTSVTIITSRLIQGKRRDNGKTWARWADDQKYGLWRNKNGTISAFQKNEKMWTSPDTTYSIIDPSIQTYLIENKAVELFTENVKSIFNIHDFTDIFPIAKLFELTSYPYLPKTIVGSFRAQDMMEFTTRVFGKSNYRKDLVRACAKSNAPTVAVAKEFKGLVPSDWLVRFINESSIGSHTYGNLTGLRAILKNIDNRSYRRMIYNGMSDRDMVSLENLCTHYRGESKRARVQNRESFINYPEGIVRSVEYLHDRMLVPVFGGTSMLTPAANEEISQTLIAKKIYALELQGMRMEVPKDTDTMRSWGEYMHQCIGMYVYAALDGSSTFGAVFQDDQMMANFQISGGRLIQLLGRFNEVLKEPVRGQITDALRGADVDVSSYMGDSAWEGNAMFGQPQPLQLIQEEEEHEPVQRVIEPVAFPIRLNFADLLETL